MTDFEETLRRNATYWSEDGEGTAGYLLSEEQFKAITRAHEADIERIIGGDERYLDAGMTNFKVDTRNELRAMQRSRAKLPEEGAK